MARASAKQLPSGRLMKISELRPHGWTPCPNSPPQIFCKVFEIIGLDGGPGEVRTPDPMVANRNFLFAKSCRSRRFANRYNGLQQMAENRTYPRPPTNWLNLPCFATTRITFLAHCVKHDTDGAASAFRATRKLKFTLPLLLLLNLVVFYLGSLRSPVARPYKTQSQEARCNLSRP